ncbi:TIGR01459 family HAD-type hydrolase [Mangrovicella endophytica]|uniref:TIGR01459 family HAD-type hydrolase n=1 Tax=Mangrovicella endophytica TaxID=2066697 RepID=UPI000C9DBDC1|nr:TIGR01459 family HAD-type hydrolase [Mangrovicella endophytica]
MDDGISLRLIERLEEVSGAYGAILCDIWGVVHNGITASQDAARALAGARRRGLKVALLTNSPRLASGVERQLESLGVPQDAYDAIITSGDVTRQLIAEGSRRVLHIGPERDLEIFGGLDVERVAEEDAEVIIATGLFDDETETPEDYADQLRRLAVRDLPMVCANPDIVVHRGDRLLFCAGALARDYEALGGSVRLAGKPYRPIYELAVRTAGIVAGTPILAIGDGMPTDIRGANNFGVDALFITGGIHSADFEGGDAAAVAAGLAANGLSARYAMPALA